MISPIEVPTFESIQKPNFDTLASTSSAVRPFFRDTRILTCFTYLVVDRNNT